jgi:hypothetical protein
MLVFLVSVLFVATASAWNPNIADCPALPAHTPTDITDLMPSNIGVVAALGDSITAGFAMDGLSDPLLALDEFRGKTSAVGGDKDALTIGNFIARYNPRVQGRALGHRLGEMTGSTYKYKPEVDHLNAAQSGAQSSVLVREVSYVVQQMKSNPKIDFANDWKSVSVLIGANDGCSICRGNGHYLNITQKADQFEANVRAAIEAVASQIPRTLISISVRMCLLLRPM